MPNIFLVSDTHFGHANILKFTKADGSPVRSFSCVEEMDDHMVDCWNKVVKPVDKVYHLGDVAMKHQDIKTVARCNGHKRLLRGNHDIHDLKKYTPYFEEVYATRLLDNMLLSHIPIHPGSLMGRGVNIHGHVHNNVPELHFGVNYLNVSVEMINYTPISLEDAKKIFRDRGAF
jgi:calcineurin-like phosphoesterase family protein